MVITGLSEVIGSWKIIEISLPRTSLHRRLVERQQVDAGERDRAADDAAGRIRQQPQQRKRGDALAAARFADDRQRLAVPQREGDAVDRLDDPVAGIEVGLQVPRPRAASRRRRFAGASAIASMRRPASQVPLSGVEDVAQRVAEQVGAEHGETDGDAGEDHQPWRGAHVFGCRLRQHAAPRRMRLGDAETQERQARLR